MFHKIKDFFKTRSEYYRSMIELSAAVTAKLNQLMDAELARTRAELKALETVKEINKWFKEFLVEVKESAIKFSNQGIEIHADTQEWID